MEPSGDASLKRYHDNTLYSLIWKMSNRFPGCFVYVHDGSATEIDPIADKQHVALIFNDTGAIYCQGHREGLSEVIWGYQQFLNNKSRNHGAKDLQMVPKWLPGHDASIVTQHDVLRPIFQADLSRSLYILCICWSLMTSILAWPEKVACIRYV